MAHLKRYDDKIIHYAVELFHENNRRQSKLCLQSPNSRPGYAAVTTAARPTTATDTPPPVTQTTGMLWPPTISAPPGRPRQPMRA